MEASWFWKLNSGQPLICGSVIDFFEHAENGKQARLRPKVIMQLAGGLYQCQITPKNKSQKSVIKLWFMAEITTESEMWLCGFLHWIPGTSPMPSSSTPSALHPEKCKARINVIRAMALKSETTQSFPIHDHRAGGHLNCLSNWWKPRRPPHPMTKLPVGGPTLSAKEIVGNESQERMVGNRQKTGPPCIKSRSRAGAPFYVVARTTGGECTSKLKSKNLAKRLSDETWLTCLLVAKTVLEEPNQPCGCRGGNLRSGIVLRLYPRSTANWTAVALQGTGWPIKWIDP